MDPTASPPKQVEDNDELIRRANEEIYKKNFELSIRIKSLNVLKALYDVAISSHNVTDMGQDLANALVESLNLPTVIIFATDKDNLNICPIAATNNEITKNSLQILNRTLSELCVPLSHPENLISLAIRTNTAQESASLFPFFTPNASAEQVNRITETSGIKHILVYPLNIQDKTIGALAIALSKPISNLSLVEKESLVQLTNVVSIAIDRAQLHQEIIEANQHLTELDKMKDEFLSLASHELRTPMTAIKGYVWMIQNGKAGNISDTAKNYLDIIYKSTERLIHFVSNMLDTSRIESGKLQLKIEPVTVSDILNQVKNEFAATASSKNMSLTTSIEGEIPPISADKDKIIQVIENLVGNSLKYTPDGGKVSITSKVSGQFVEISVTDTGKGIAETDIPKLFNKFTRLGDRLTTYSQPGTGLGLYLARQFVELHHGKISVTSKFGAGSTFTFTLPLSNNT